MEVDRYLKDQGDGVFLSIGQEPHICNLPGERGTYSAPNGTEWMCNGCARVWKLHLSRWQKVPTSKEIAQKRWAVALSTFQWLLIVLLVLQVIPAAIIWPEGPFHIVAPSVLMVLSGIIGAIWKAESR